MRIRKTLIFMLVVGCLFYWSRPPGLSAATGGESYFQAEACYQKLRKDPQKQKYRYHWMKCIDKFREVYRHDPSGQWTAAGLYMTGTLYFELYKRSGKHADRKEAIDHFERIVKRFPNSGYYDRARKAIRLASQDSNKPGVKNQADRKSATGKSPPAKEKFHRAEACYQSLLNHPGWQKYRDKWLACIKKFDAAYRHDPSGPWAAVSLFMSGSLYYELYKHSYNDTDRQLALENFERIVQRYSKSEYKKKAVAAIDAIKRDENLLAVLKNGNGDRKKTSDTTHKNPTIPKSSTQNNEPGKKASKAAPGRVSTVTGMRFWSNPNYTRLVIDLDRETTFTYNLLNKDPSLKKPQRLYVDLHHSRLGENIQKIIPIEDDLLAHARAGQYSRTDVRVVTDIKSLKTYEIFTLKDPFRIVMDIKGEGGDAGADQPEKDEKPNPEIARIDPRVTTDDIAKQLSLGVRRIVIDPGHGGRDYGAPGCLKGVHEKKVVLQIGKRLAQKLRKELKCEVIMTRNSDRFLTLEERTAFANTKNADLFISIHTNANRDSRAYGISTYFLNMASDEEAKRVAAKENATSTNNISDLEKILFSLMHNAKINESSRLAAHIQDSVTLQLKKKGYSRVKDKGVKQAPFYVLLGAQMPSVLIETSFISNPRECRRLINTKYQDRLCEGIVKGVKQYIKETNPTAFRDTRSKDHAAGLTIESTEIAERKIFIN